MMPSARIALCLSVVTLLALFPASAGPRAAKARPAPAATAAPEPPAGPPFRVAENGLRALEPRSIGPAIMGGRISDIALDPVDPATFYVGVSMSGVWKTTDAGFTFAPVFDKQPVQSIGAVAVAPSDGRIVWVGTGEANDRNSSGWGRGVYRSTDGGGSWTLAGLSESRTIARIAVHPKDPATAYVAAMGSLWAPGGERGLYKTTDAGKTWTRVLAAPAPDDAITGCGDVALDPSQPETVYAALYPRRRLPWRFDYGVAVTGGRDVGGIFKSTDGGRTWRKLSAGLPPKTGRIGLSVYARDPRVVMAVVQSDEGGTSGWDIRSRAGGIFRSEDGGESFTRVNPLNPRPFYFSQVRIDPVNDQRVYVLGFALHVSDDGGRTFREDLFGKVHPDLHALAITPLSDAGAAEIKRREEESRREAEQKAAEQKAKAAQDGSKDGAPEPPPQKPPRPPVSPRLLLGTDGGVYQSFDAARSWAHLDRIPSAQYYRIAVDDGDDKGTPYRICGGLQDNNNWVGPSRTWSKDGIRNGEWINLGGGDGFACVFDPADRDVIYTESQEGDLFRANLRTGEKKTLRPVVNEGQPAFRYHWNAPLLGSRHAKGTMYLGGNRVFRLTRQGEHWEAISPDLSKQEPEKIMSTGSGAENYGVVYTLAESPRAAGMLWAGTDDGKLWQTRDDGAHWTDLTASLPAPVQGQWLGRVEPSWHDAEVAYLAVPAYRGGNDAPLAYRTRDGGKTWQSVAGDLPKEGPVHVVREDPRNARVLYAGTEFGLYVSLDAGTSWTRLRGVPPVRTEDIVVHERTHDLVVATHGRGLYVFDDASVFAALTTEVAAKTVALVPPRPAFGRYILDGWADWNGTAVFSGPNPPDGAVITFWCRESTGESVSIAITNAQGQPVAKLTAPGTAGIGRVTWNLRPTADVLTEYGGAGGGKFVAPGTYDIAVTRGEDSAHGTLDVRIAEGIEPR